MRETRNSRCGKGPPTPVVPPTLGSASCPGPQSSLLFSSSARRAGGVATCKQMLQLASVSLDLHDSYLDDQEVAHETVWSNLRHQPQRGSFQFVVAGLPSSTVALPVRDTQQCLWNPEFRCKKALSAPVPCRWHTHRRSLGGANRRGVQPCASIDERISGSTSVSLPGLTIYVSHVALFQVGTNINQAHRLQATVSWCRSLGPRSGPVLEGRPLGNGSAVRRSRRRAVIPDPGSQVVGNHYGRSKSRVPGCFWF